MSFYVKLANLKHDCFENDRKIVVRSHVDFTPDLQGHDFSVVIVGGLEEGHLLIDILAGR